MAAYVGTVREVVKSGQASFSYNRPHRALMHLLVVKSGQASFSYNPDFFGAGGFSCEKRAGVIQLQYEAQPSPPPGGCEKRAGVIQLQSPYVACLCPDVL